MQETGVRFLGWEDALEKEMATHSSVLAGESHGQRNLADFSPWGCRVRQDSMHASLPGDSVDTDSPIVGWPLEVVALDGALKTWENS